MTSKNPKPSDRKKRPKKTGTLIRPKATDDESMREAADELYKFLRPKDAPESERSQ